MDKTKILVGALTLAVALAVVFAVGMFNRMNDDEVNAVLAEQKVLVQEEYKASLDSAKELFRQEIDAKVADYESKLSEKETDIAAKAEEIDALNAEIAALDDEVTQLQEPAVDEFVGYTFDGVAFDGNFEGTIDNGDLAKLLEDEIRYDGENYDFEEVLYLSEDLLPLLNLEGFDGAVGLGITSDNAIIYKYVFDDLIVVDGSEEELDITFLGAPLTIIDFDGSELTYRTSAELAGSTGDSFEVEGKTVTIIAVSDNSALIDVDGVAKAVDEGNARTINGVRVEVNEVFTSDFSDYTYVKFFVGDEISETVETGDEYTADDRYEWIVESDAIGVALVEQYDDEDEAFKVGDSISLPNDYVTFKFGEVLGLDYEDVKFKISGNDLDVSFTGDIEINGKRIDDAKFSVDLDTLEYEYKYKDDKFVESDFSLIKFVFDDRSDFDFSVAGGEVSLSGDKDYVFAYSGNEFVESLADATNMNEDDHYLLVNGDLLYKSSVNEDDGYKEVEFGLVKDLGDVEAQLFVY